MNDSPEFARKEIFNMFTGMSNPFYMVSFRQDVTKLYDYAKQENISFYCAMIWLCTKAINGIDAFCWGIKDGNPSRCEERIPSFTDMRKGEELFHIVTLPAGDDLKRFCTEAKAKSDAQTEFIDMSLEGDNLIYFSCLPWIDMTAITNERDLNAAGAQDESIPRIAWGKITEENGRKLLGITVEVNHRLIDGWHIGRFSRELGQLINGLPVTVTDKETLYKLEIYIPESHLRPLQQALQSVDAGHIGNYDSCISYNRGTGVWRPLSGTNPYIGSEGELSEEPELKVEVCVKASRLDETMKAIKAVHPYEEPVINVLQLMGTGL